MPGATLGDVEGYFDSATEAAKVWGRDVDVIRVLCRTGLLPGAFKDGRDWKIPFEAEATVRAHKREKLTKEDRREIARLAHAGANRSRLARAYGVERLHVYRMMEKYPPGNAADVCV